MNYKKGSKDYYDFLTVNLSIAIKYGVLTIQEWFEIDTEEFKKFPAEINEKIFE